MEIEIKEKKFPASVRDRANFLMGALTDSGQLLREIFDNSKDEVMANFCENIWIDTNHPYKVVADNGRGIPIKLVEGEEELTQFELAVTSISAGGKYDSKEAQGGLNGVGSAATNALSDHFLIASRITEKNYDKSTKAVLEYWSSISDPEAFLTLQFEKGIKVAEKIYNLDQLREILGVEVPESMSTIVGFIPDTTIVGSAECTIQKEWVGYIHLVMDKFYNKTVSILNNGNLELNDLKLYSNNFITEVEFVKPGINKGFKSFLSFEIVKELNDWKYEGSVNSLMVNEGLHVKYAQSAICSALRKVIETDLPDHWLLYGVKLVHVILCNKVGYSAQIKKELVYVADLNTEDWNALESDLVKIITADFDWYYAHVSRVQAWKDSMETFKNTEFLKKLVGLSTSGTTASRSYLPVKLKDCSTPHREKAELYLCEGDSAAGSLSKARLTEFHAVLPLRGKSLNTSKLDAYEAMNNEELKGIVCSIGTGMDVHFDMSTIRYGKIFIVADADIDGLHIEALLLGFFACHMQYLIEAGMIYVMDTPTHTQGDKFIYRDTMEELDVNKNFEHIKGLGELAPSDIYRALIDPETRRVIQITMENVDDAIRALTDKNYRSELMLNAGLTRNGY